MARRHHYRRRVKPPMELEVTTFLNLMVVLVPFLLITAVFSRITIVELDLPSEAGGPSREPPGFRVEVIVRENGVEISNGTAVIASIPNVDDDYDLPSLSEHMVALKRDHRQIDAASVLLEPQIPYDYLIRVMDVVRSVEVPGATPGGGAGDGAGDASGDAGEAPVVQYAALFPNISIGEAP